MEETNAHDVEIKRMDLEFARHKFDVDNDREWARVLKAEAFYRAIGWFLAIGLVGTFCAFVWVKIIVA